MALVVLYSKSSANSSGNVKAVQAALAAFLEVEGKIIFEKPLWSPANRDDEFPQELRARGFTVVSTGHARTSETNPMNIPEPHSDFIVSYCVPDGAAELISYAHRVQYVALLLPGDFWLRRESFRLFLKHPPTYVYPLISNSTQDQLMWSVWDRERGAPGILPSTFRPLLL